ncbi:MAG: right-handed parallel beta-helix repeat-containing protein [Solirubrobacterales bacterium]
MKGTPLGFTKKRRRRTASAVAAGGLLLLGATGHQASASQLVVTNLSADGTGSFAAAAREANLDDDSDQIVFAEGLRGTIPITETLRFIRPVEITGPGAGVNGDDLDGPVLKGPADGASLLFDSGAELGSKEESRLSGLDLERLRVDVRSSPLVIQDSHVTGDGVGGNGVYVYGYLTPARVAIRDSTVTGFGLGVNVQSSSATIDGSVISDNWRSGGVYAGGYAGVTIADSLITGNVAQPDVSRKYAPVPASGAGVQAGYESSIDLVNSTIMGNVAVGEGSYGGGVAGASSGDMTIIGSTVLANSAEIGGGIASDSGGKTGYNKFAISDSVVTGNESTEDGAGGDCGGSHLRSNGGNILGSPGACALDPTDVAGVGSPLAPLTDSRGNSPVEALHRVWATIDRELNPIHPLTDEELEDAFEVQDSTEDGAGENCGGSDGPPGSCGFVPSDLPGAALPPFR